MKIKIYSGVDGMKVPNWGDFENTKDYFAAEDKYFEDLKAYCKAKSKSPHAGKVIRFPVGDGYATYVVLKPSELIHDITGDAYHFRYIENFSAADVTREIKLQEQFDAIFS
jgi:hypothetical protein